MLGMTCKLAVLTQLGLILYSFLILLAFVLLIVAFFVTNWISKHERALSPYSKLPLRNGEDISFDNKKKILKFLFDLHQYDNQIFEFSKAAVCRETGRIFINCRTWYGTMHVDWTFLQKRFPGQYVSWGSLSDRQQESIRDSHHSLLEFQTERSSANAAPSAIEPEFAFTVPGPLYVDINTKILLGWQCVPDTDFEVLIVQKPKPKFENSSIS